jgi:hypothetical protein
MNEQRRDDIATARATKVEVTSDEKTFYAPTLMSAEVRISIVDEYILLRLDTANEQTWWRLSRENFFGLTEYLNDEARRLREQ